MLLTLIYPLDFIFILYPLPVIYFHYYLYLFLYSINKLDSINKNISIIYLIRHYIFRFYEFKKHETCINLNDQKDLDTNSKYQNLSKYHCQFQNHCICLMRLFIQVCDRSQAGIAAHHCQTA